MKKTRKQVFAEYLSNHTVNLNSSGVMELSNSKDLGIQVKTLNSEGDFVIKFSSSDPWIKPLEWLHNYRVSVKERYEEASFVYHSVFSPDEDGNAMAVMKDKADRFENLKQSIAQLGDSINICDADSEDKLAHFPKDMDKALSILNRVHERWPKIFNRELLVLSTIGLSCREAFELDQEFAQTLTNLAEEWKNAGQSKSD